MSAEGIRRPAQPDALVEAHKLQSPTLKTARDALHGLYGPHTADLWRTLLFSAGLTGDETDLNSFNRLVDCMKVADPITRLCGRSLAVRAATYARLSDPTQQNRQN